MLKIKANVDLKELKKYGFKKDKDLSNGTEKIYSVVQKYQKLCVSWEDKLLFLCEPFNSNAFFLETNILYDLIKDDLVEKVSDE